jgi:hypothetical protein
MQLHYNCTHDIMLMSLIVIHLLKFSTCHYEDFWTNYFLFKILISIMIVNDGQDYDTWHNKKLQHGILIIFWNK